jgi:hypothetical protein
MSLPTGTRLGPYAILTAPSASGRGQPFWGRTTLRHSRTRME